MATVVELAEALADALTPLSPPFPTQVVPRYLFAPGGPCIDVYPSTPAEAYTTFGEAERMHWFTVRLRVPTADSAAAQDFLYAAREPMGPGSIRDAVLNGTALAELVDGILEPPDSPTGFRIYEDSGGAGAVVRYIGEEWRFGLMVGDDGATS